MMLLLLSALAAEPVHVQIDWQGHPAMHIPWWMFRQGLTDRTPRLSWRHTFRQTMYEPYVRRSGVRILLTAAMAAERAKNPTQARALILEQLHFIEAFVAAHPAHYAMARTPGDVRRLIKETDKIVVIHSIEGGHLLLEQPGDAQFWADQGVALVTLIHLRDDELGGSAILPEWMGPIINRAGNRARRRGERRGLTKRGADVIVELDAAGILVDFSHMTSTTIEDALAVTREHGIAPVFTHGQLASIRNTEFGLTEDTVVEVYRQGGLVSLGLSGVKLAPHEPSVPVESHCEGTLESFRVHTQAVHAIVAAHADELSGGVDPDQVATRFAVGWSSDWNGWLPHSRPRYANRRCGERPETLDELDRRGLSHPGLLPAYFEQLEADGLDLEPMLRSSERFLQIWEQARQ